MSNNRKRDDEATPYSGLRGLLTFPWAPITRARAWFMRDEVLEYLNRKRPSRVGLAALGVARSELGNGESGGNNVGPDVERYRAGHGGNGAWCAAFVYFCIDAAFGELGHRNPIKRTHSARRLFGRVASTGSLVDLVDIQPGDIVLWARGRTRSGKGHIGIVSEVIHNSAGAIVAWHYIAGNEGRTPALVSEHNGHSRRRRIGFARLSCVCHSVFLGLGDYASAGMRR
jgi:hypothetical protein